jgi:hypothetical protein
MSYVTFGLFSRYFVAAECVVMILVLLLLRKQIERQFLAVWFVVLVLSIACVEAVSGLQSQLLDGSPLFASSSLFVLLRASTPAVITVATVALCAMCGGLLHPSANAFVPCLCGSVTVHPRTLWLLFGLGLFVCNALTVSALKADAPLTLVATYFACPAILALLVVLSLRVVVARTVDSKVGSIAMLGGVGVVAVGVAAVAVLYLTYGCGWITNGGTPSATCPLPSSVDAGAVINCFLASGLVIVFIGLRKIACEVHGQLHPGVADERQGMLVADGRRVSRYLRVDINRQSAEAVS